MWSCTGTVITGVQPVFQNEDDSLNEKQQVEVTMQQEPSEC